MKLLALAVTIGTLFSVTSAQAGMCDFKAGSAIPSYCETPKVVPTPKAAAPQAPAAKPKYQAPRKAPPPYSPPRKRYEDSPLFIVPSLFGMLLAGSVDAVEDGVKGVYHGVKGLTGHVAGDVYSGVDSVMPDKRYQQ